MEKTNLIFRIRLKRIDYKNGQITSTSLMSHIMIQSNATILQKDIVASVVQPGVFLGLESTDTQKV